MPAPMDARIELLKNKLRVKLEARAAFADTLRRLRSSAKRGDSKAGREFEAHLDKVMLTVHRIDTGGSYPHKSPHIQAAKKLTAGDIARHAGAESGRVIHNPSASTVGGGKFENKHYGAVHPQLAARRASTIQRAAAAKVSRLVARRAGVTASERVRRAWVTRKKLHQYGKAGQTPVG